MTNIADILDRDGWIEWRGRECPVPPETVVQFRLDNGRLEHFEMPAGRIQWDNSRRLIKLAAYRILETTAPLPGRREGERPITTLALTPSEPAANLLPAVAEGRVSPFAPLEHIRQKEQG